MKIELNKIYKESCLETLKRMKDNSIDSVITSPPYNMNLRIRNGVYCSRQIVKELSTKYANFDDNLPIDEYYELHLSILKELLRVSNMVFYNIQIVTGSKRAIFKIIGELSDYLKDIVIWDKGNGQPAMAERVMNRRTELILIFDKNNAISRQFDVCNFKRGTLDDLWLIKRGKKVSSEHGAVFPEELIYTILENFTKEGNTIYDPFMGTGTTAVVSKKLKRNYIGSEISEEYIKVAKKRLKELDGLLNF
jgi:site-specific DNA-methyltransferase (adenine-specific)/modification methylase